MTLALQAGNSASTAKCSWLHSPRLFANKPGTVDACQGNSHCQLLMDSIGQQA
ncbi:hypothetical protein [Paracoccus benzoatiresistens]|uniref:Uncharacterized protein n=1 Tax=Paracoccus benzoatiresistens TaxID=2997341 RepID=A0ABT4J5W6_9RHOB|nr:hypothetical protein [Paracoccus sp. EF6]MCZ0962520.1 hypothetical protein [Paracoccus sp. EF6]